MALLSAPASLWLISSQLVNTNIFLGYGFGLPSYFDGTASRPFAYRVATVWLMRLIIFAKITHITLPFIDQIAAAQYPRMQEVPPATFEQIKSYVIAGSTCAYGFLVATFACARRVFGSPLWGFAALALALFGVNAIMLEHHGHIYDFSVLFLATLLFMQAEQQNDTIFLAILAIGCLTKESLSLYILIYAAIAFGTRPAFEIVRNFAIQCSMFALTYAYVTFKFAGNPGTAMMNNIPLHWRYILNHGTVTYFGIFLLFLVLLLYRFEQKPRNIRRAMAILPLFALLGIIGGTPGEFRIVFDIFPVFLLPVTDSFRKLTAGT